MEREKMQEAQLPTRQAQASGQTPRGSTSDEKEELLQRAFVGSYELGDRQRADIANRFAHHPPVGDQLERYRRVRTGCRELAEQITMLTPPGREQAVALTNLEQVMFWANAAIARGEQP